jgi:ribonuclease VapC
VIIDPSALAAILLEEPDAGFFAATIAAAQQRRISAASYVELAAVLDNRRNPVLSGALDATLAAARIEIAPLTIQQARLARDAYGRFGRGSGHPARLNMGDCVAYALARELGEPLLFKGRDFALTDIELVTEPDRRKRLSESVAAYTASLPGYRQDGRATSG